MTSSPQPTDTNNNNQWGKKLKTKMIESKSKCLERFLRFICADHNSARLTLITLAATCSFIGATVLVIAGEPSTNHGPLYQFGDLVRIVSHLHSQEIADSDINNDGDSDSNIPENVPDPESNISTTPITEPESTTTTNMLASVRNDSRMARFLQKWWPVKQVAFHSQNLILDDHNFYTRNYVIYQSFFIVFILLGDLILFLTLVIFSISKCSAEREMQRKRAEKNEVSSESRNESRANRMKSTVRKVYNQNVETIKSCWREKRVGCNFLEPVTFGITVLALLHLLMLCILLSRPNLFALIVHQVSFILLAMVGVASTAIIRQSTNDTFFNKNTRQTMSKRSQRQFETNSGENPRKLSPQSPKQSTFPRNSSDTMSITHQSHNIFTTKQSLLQSVPPAAPPPTATAPADDSTYPVGANPFGDEDDKSIPDEPIEVKVDRNRRQSAMKFGASNGNNNNQNTGPMYSIELGKEIDDIFSEKEVEQICICTKSDFKSGSNAMNGKQAQ